MTPFSTFLLESRRAAFMDDVKDYAETHLRRIKHAENSDFGTGSRTRERIEHPDIPGGYLDITRMAPNFHHVSFEYEPNVHGAPGHKEIPELTANAIGFSLAVMRDRLDHNPHLKFGFDPLTGTHNSMYSRGLIPHINKSKSGILGSLKGDVDPDDGSDIAFSISHRFPNDTV